MNTEEALKVVKGKKPACSVDHFFDCYQWLYDNNVELDLPEQCMLDKLICDAVIVTEENSVTYRGISAMGAVQLGDSE